MPEATATPAAPAAESAALPAPTGLRGREAGSQEKRPGGEVRAELSKDKPVTPAEAMSALDWFLSEDENEDDLTQTIELNVGVSEEQWINWTIRTVDQDEMRRIQRQSAALRRRSNQDDLAIDFLANLRVTIAGTVNPDITALAEQSGKEPVAILRHKFRHKPGLISQIATRIMALSGFDDEDVRDAVAAKN